MMNRFSGKTVFITGAAGGLGRAMCIRLGQEGATVVAADIDQPRLDAVAGELGGMGIEIAPIHLDVSDASAFMEAMQTVVGRFGRLDVAVNNAGMGGDMAPLADYPLETWDKVMSINVSSVFYGMRAQIPQMLKQSSGSIVNVASIMGSVAMPAIAPYVASKHAVVGLTKASALEYGKHGIRINAIGPSFVRTGFTAACLPDDRTWDALAGQHALAGTGTPEDIAAAVAFLASSDARFITGSLYVVDGGYTAA